MEKKNLVNQIREILPVLVIAHEHDLVSIAKEVISKFTKNEKDVTLKELEAISTALVAKAVTINAKNVSKAKPTTPTAPKKDTKAPKKQVVEKQTAPKAQVKIESQVVQRITFPSELSLPDFVNLKEWKPSSPEKAVEELQDITTQAILDPSKEEIFLAVLWTREHLAKFEYDATVTAPKSFPEDLDILYPLLITREGHVHFCSFYTEAIFTVRKDEIQDIQEHMYVAGIECHLYKGYEKSKAPKVEAPKVETPKAKPAKKVETKPTEKSKSGLSSIQEALIEMDMIDDEPKLPTKKVITKK